MSPSPRSGPHAPATPLASRAREDLRVIRETMQRAATFTSVPSWTGALMGAVGLAAAWVAAHESTSTRQLGAWLVAAVVAAVIAGADVLGLVSTHPRAALTHSARRFLLALAPAFLGTALLTVALARAGLFAWLPPVWLLGYGAAVVAAGAVSIRPVTWMGVCFLGLGTASLATPPAWGNLWLAAGFGGLHVVFGLAIARSRRG